MGYTGKKWRVKDEVVGFASNDWWDDTKELKPVFGMTRGYAKYLREKREAELADRIRCMREKLEYQEKKYGEVDPIDLSEFMALVQQAQAH